MSKSAARLAWPFAVSLALHLGLAWLLSPGLAERLPRRAKAIMLTVSLPGKERLAPPSASVAAPKAAPPAPAAAAGAADTAGELTQKARFLVAPDLSSLEEIQVPFAGTLNLRLNVSSRGLVEGITVLKSDPVPKELLDGLLKRLEQTRLAPALAGSKSVASSVDLVIRFEPAPALLRRDPMPDIPVE